MLSQAMAKLLLFVILAVVLAWTAAQLLQRSSQLQYAPIVKLNSGKVRGRVQVVTPEKQLYFYQGIRYGNANRFQKPTPVSNWTDIYDATFARESCVQWKVPINGSENVQTDKMAENCLFLNIWKPIENKANQSVLVFFHGGAFAIGSIFAEYFDAKHVASRGDIIVVTIAYRLSALGFLYGGDVPGNLGLHDQILGLKWVKENIGKFGGDPEQITISGSSAGSVSVGALVISPLANGLFKRAILMSGAPNSELVVSKEAALKTTKQLAIQVNCQTENILKMIVCLRGKTAQELVSKTPLNFDKFHNLFWPVYDDEVLPVAPVEALKLGKFNKGIDVLFGVSDREGSSFILHSFPKLLASPANMTVDSTKKDIIYLMKEVFKRDSGAEVAEFYMKDLVNPTEDQLKIILSNVWGDYALVCPTILFGEQLAGHALSNKYYSYREMQPLQQSAMPSNIQPWMGTMHGSDWLLLFKVPFVAASEKDRMLSDDMSAAFVAFAKTGDPGKMANVKWTEAFEKNTPKLVTRHMALDVKNYRMISQLYKKTCGFLKEKIRQN